MVHGAARTHTRPKGSRQHHVALQGSYVNLTADSALLTACEPHLDSLLGAISARASTAPVATDSWASTLPRCNEALLVPTQVNYVGKAANLFEDAGAALSWLEPAVQRFPHR